jgi:hypothetical protein
MFLWFFFGFSFFQTKETDGRVDRENRLRRIKAFQGSTDWLLLADRKKYDKADGWMNERGFGIRQIFFFFFFLHP